MRIMKLKGKTALGMKAVAIISAAAYALLLIVRIYQSLMLTDGATGFFTGDNITVPLMYILFIGSVVAVCALCYVCSKLPSGEMSGKSSIFFIFAGVFFSFTLLYSAIPGLNTIRQAGSIVAAKAQLGGNLGILSVVFALISAVVILVSSFMANKGKKAEDILKLPMLFPVIWAFCEVLGFFSVPVSYIKIPQLLLTIFSAVFLMIFLFENARVVSGIGKKDALWFFFASGIIAAGLGLCCSIPSLIVSVIKPENTVSYCPFEPYQLGGAVYALAVIAARSKKAKKDDGTEQPVSTVTETL